jgi:hypothetical protein
MLIPRWGLPCTRAGDIGAPRPENTGSVVIQTHPSLGVFVKFLEKQ